MNAQLCLCIRQILDYILANGSSLIIQLDHLFYFHPEYFRILSCPNREKLAKLRIGKEVSGFVVNSMVLRIRNPIIQDIYYVRDQFDSVGRYLWSTTFDLLLLFKERNHKKKFFNP